ncbi:MAG TPA: hypothetical protein VN436_11335, partial [Holophaga sp.]|nr:hypothetical protein [Holophaga sp.]
MPFPIRLRLRSLLPMLLAGVASLGFLVVFGYRRAQETRHARLVNAEILKGQAIALRNTVSDLLATHHPEQAERRLLDATLDPRVRVLALVNREGRVLISNRRRWLDQPGSVLDDFAPAKAGQALAHAIDLFEPVGASHVAGYFPLEPDLGESALREPERGLLYASYDLTPDLEQARYRVRLEGGWIFAYFSLAALLTYLLLDRWVTRKIDRMVRTMQRVA